jgi:hypothetical protein
MRRPRLLAYLAVAALVFAACGGGDDSSGGSSSTTKADTVGNAYLDALAGAFAGGGKGQGIANSQAEADCAAKKIVDAVGEQRLVAAGVTTKVLKSTGFSSGFPKMSADDANAIIDAAFSCIDVGASFGRQLVSGGASTKQAKCLDKKLKGSASFRQSQAASFREGAKSSPTDEATAGEVVGIVFDCVGQGEYFRAQVAGSITLTDAQVACLNDSLASSNDFRDAVVKAFIGQVDPASAPAYADEVEKCVPADQLTPTSS